MLKSIVRFNTGTINKTETIRVTVQVSYNTGTFNIEDVLFSINSQLEEKEHFTKKDIQTRLITGTGNFTILKSIQEFYAKNWKKALIKGKNGWFTNVSK